jgi:glycosyltransferase involved in cell wall biosynthesis
LEQLIEAVALLTRGVLVVLGDGPLLQQMKRDISQLGLTQRVHLLGRVSMAELPSYTAAANVGVALIQNVCLSYYYCLPNKLFEYLQAGVPVVASDFPEIRRVVQEFEVGELVDPSRPTEIAGAIQRLIDDPARYARLCLNARKAAERMNWEQEEERLIHVYDKVQQAMR